MVGGGRDWTTLRGRGREGERRQESPAAEASIEDRAGPDSKSG